MNLPNSYQRRSWHLDDIDFNAIDIASVRDDNFLFLTLASASFVEILSEMYAANLIEHFQGDSELTNWLSEYWQRDEVQHGQALRTYVQTVWPDFEWDNAYNAFFMHYSTLCTVEQLEPSKALELLARCVIETGTSSFYRALQQYVREPVLRHLIGHIRADEISHYVYFRKYFTAYNAIERHGVGASIATIWRRLSEIRGEDVYIAFKHVHGDRYSNQPYLEADWRRYNQTVKRLARNYYPYLMTVKMLMKPIPMFESIKKMLQWPLVGLAMLISLG